MIAQKKKELQFPYKVVQAIYTDPDPQPPTLPKGHCLRLMHTSIRVPKKPPVNLQTILLPSTCQLFSGRDDNKSPTIR